MKNFTKKRGFFAVAVALLIVTAMLVTTWCSSGVSNDEYTPPPGKGAVRLSFNKEIARTILPDDADITDFDEFEFQFTPTPTGSVINITVPKANLYDPIVLDPGDYDLIVIAYIEDSLNVMQPVATNATAVSVTIEAGKIAKETITLEVIAPDGTKTGTFSYTLTDDDIVIADITTASMSLTPIGTGVAQGPIDIKAKFGASATSITVVAGYYYVDFTLKVGGDTVTFRHVVHIYPNMTSSYTFSIGLDYFNAVFQLESGDIEFENPEDLKPELSYSINTSPSATTGTLVDKGTITVSRGRTLTLTISNDVAADYTGYEWYCLGTTSRSSTNTYVMSTAATTDLYYSARDYNLTVVGVKGSKKYASVITVSVTP